MPSSNTSSVHPVSWIIWRGVPSSAMILNMVNIVCSSVRSCTFFPVYICSFVSWFSGSTSCFCSPFWKHRICARLLFFLVLGFPFGICLILERSRFVLIAVLIMVLRAKIVVSCTPNRAGWMELGKMCLCLSYSHWYFCLASSTFSWPSLQLHRKKCVLHFLHVVFSIITQCILCGSFLFSWQ